MKTYSNCNYNYDNFFKEKDAFVLSTLKENVDLYLLHCLSEKDVKVYTKKIYFYELDCNIIINLIWKNYSFDINTKKNSDYVQIENDNIFNKFNIYLKTTSLINTSTLKVIFKSFLFTFNCTMNEYLFHNFLLRRNWHNFWIFYGEAFSYLSWIFKYKDFINIKKINSLNNISRFLTNTIHKHMQKLKIEISTSSIFEKKKKLINLMLLSARNIFYFTKLQCDSIFDILLNQSLSCSYNNMWNYLWHKHNLQYYNTCYMKFKQYYTIENCICEKVRSFPFNTTVEELYSLLVEAANKIFIESANKLLQNKIYNFDKNRFNTLIYSDQTLKESNFCKNDISICIRNTENFNEREKYRNITNLKYKINKYWAFQNYVNNKKKIRLELTSNILTNNLQNSILKKYWSKRYRLFSKFDDGIQLDSESWFSVTPEKIAKHIANRCECDILIDAFCGAGGNSIHFASTCEIVYAIDIDPQKIAIIKHNANIYNVNHKIEFILGDFFTLADNLIGDVVFLSPPWGGPSYIHNTVYDIKNIMSPKGGIMLLEKSKKISNNIAFYLPKNINMLQLSASGGPGSKIEIENNYLNSKLVAITAYYGNLLK